MTPAIRATILGVIAAACATGAFFADPIWLRIALGVLTFLAALGSCILWPLVGGAAYTGVWWQRLIKVFDMVGMEILALAAAFVGLAVLVGALRVERTDAVDLGWVTVGIAVLAVVLLAFVFWWLHAFFRYVCEYPLPIVSAVLAVLAVGALFTWLSFRAVPREDADVAIREQARRAGLGLYDLLIVIDPGDPASKELIRAARAHLRAGEEMFPIDQGPVSYDLAFGLAVTQRGKGSKPLWRLVEPPTHDGKELIESLARIKPRRGPPVPESYGRLLADVLVQDRVRWRPRAQRGVVFMLERLPKPAELDRGVRTPAEAGAIEPWAKPASACAELLRARSVQAIDGDPSARVAWGDALAAHCRLLEAYRDWQDRGRPPDVAVPEEPIAVHAVTGETRGQRAAQWWTWVRALDGEFARPPLVRRARGWRAQAELLLGEAAKLHTGQAAGHLADLVEWFRPHLLFDSAERLRPIDVDWLFAQRSGTEAHRICDRRPGKDNCERIAGATGLVGPLDDYIDLAGGVRILEDQPQRERGPERMYVHIRREGDRLFLGYWWFFPSNVSPWRPELNCLPGFTFADATCFDHEADWEGVTVEFTIERETVLPDPYSLHNVTPEAAIYDFHGRSVRWSWDDVELAADPESYATHPVVYVASGSHASYPARCTRRECNQRLGGEPLGEGRFDGGEEWDLNDHDDCHPAELDPCLVTLPSTRDGRFGMVWNAFQGRWGAAACAPIARACTQTDGPVSPSRQDRYTRPGRTVPGEKDRLEQFVRDFADPGRSQSTRWPPKPWPPPGGEPRPATPALGP